MNGEARGMWTLSSLTTEFRMHLHRCFLLALAVFPFGSIALSAQPVDIDLEFGILAGSPRSTLVNNLSGLGNSFTRTEFGHPSRLVRSCPGGGFRAVMDRRLRTIA